MLDTLKFKESLELLEKSWEAFEKLHIEIVTWFHVKLYQNNMNMTLL